MTTQEIKEKLIVEGFYCESKLDYNQVNRNEISIFGSAEIREIGRSMHIVNVIGDTEDEAVSNAYEKYLKIKDENEDNRD